MKKVFEFIVTSFLFTIGLLGAYLALVIIFVSLVVFIEWNVSVYTQVYNDIDWKTIRMTITILYVLGFVLTCQMFSEL